MIGRVTGEIGVLDPGPCQVQQQGFARNGLNHRREVGEHGVAGERRRRVKSPGEGEAGLPRGCPRKELALPNGRTGAQAVVDMVAILGVL